jgi:hypothetical protein
VLHRVVAPIEGGAELDLVGVQPVLLGHAAEEGGREAHHELVHGLVEAPAGRLADGLYRDVAPHRGPLVDPSADHLTERTGCPRYREAMPPADRRPLRSL